MKYALLYIESKPQFDRLNDPAFMGAWVAYIESLRAAGIFVAGAGLQPPETATTVSVREGKRQVQDGPYAETKELVGGVSIIDVPNLDVALEWAARSPAAGYGSVEVRPVLPTPPPTK
jgi:hypothetical protein